MNQYKFSLCLYEDQDSTNNCKEGNLTSLPLESSNVLWNIMFDNNFDSQRDTSFNITNVTQAYLEKTHAIISGGVAVSMCAVIAALCLIIIRVRRFLRKVKEENTITIPADDLDTNGSLLATIDIHKDRNDYGLTKLENKNQLEYEDESSSINTFNEYDIPQRLKNYKYAQHIWIGQRKERLSKQNTYVENNLSTCSSKKTTITEKKTVQKDNIKCTNTLGSQNGHEDKFYKENKSSLELNIKCDVVQHVRSPTRESTPHVAEATGKNYAECHYNKSNEENHDESPVAMSRDENRNDASSFDESNMTGDNDEDDNAVVPFEQNKNKLDNTDNEDYTRYNWTEIFTYLAQEIIDPKKYFLFFNILLADAGYESPDKRISAIEENTKGNIIRTLLELFYLWKDQVGSKINPKDIEDTFEKLEWNTQLHAFKKYLRAPPVLKDRNALCKHTNEQDILWPKSVEDNTNLSKFIYHGQDPFLLDDESIQIYEEVVFEHKQNGKNILKRKKSVVRKVSDRKRLKKDKNRYVTYSNASNKNSRQRISQNHRLKRAKNLYHRDKINKHPVIKKSISDENCFENSSDGFGMTCDKFCTSQARHCDHFLKGIEASAKTATGEEYASNVDSGYGSSCYTPEMTQINSDQLSHLKQLQENAAEPTRQSQMSQESNFTTKTVTEHERNKLDQATSFQRGCSYQATSDLWNVTRDIQKRPNKVNRKRHIGGARDGLEDCCFKKVKTQANSVITNTSHKRGKRGKHPFSWKQKYITDISHLVHRIERSFESRNPVNEKEFNIFINNLLSRLSNQPQKHDIVCLKKQSYITAQAFTSNNGEIIHIISTEKHLLVLKEREWTSLMTYVKYARPVLTRKTQGYVKTDFLFLSYDGKPLVQEL